MIRDHLIPQHQEFFQKLPFVLAGSTDSAGQPWASLVPGRPGFAFSPDPKHLRVGALPNVSDPLAGNLAIGSPIALLGIELLSRRRNRLNGFVSSLDAQGWTVEAVQSYGNCPQYIQSRDLRYVDPQAGTDESQATSETSRAVKQQCLRAEDASLIARSDTFFIASFNPRKEDGESHGADISHRGGRPGFVRVDGPERLTVPDFIGNFYFNTIGNLQVNPSAGLLFPDFRTGDILMLGTRATVIWEGAEVSAFEGAQRLLRFEIDVSIRIDGLLPFRSEEDPSYARELSRTGTWATCDSATPYS